MTTCEICGSSKLPRTITRGEDEIKYWLHECDDCKVIRLIAPAPKTAAYYTSGEYRKDVPRTPGAVKYARERDAKVLRSLLDLYGTPWNMLDLCAEDDSVSLPKCGISRWDISSGYLAALPESAYDLVTCFLSLEHLMHPVDMIREGLLRLRPDGLFLASVPDVDLDLGLRPHHTWYYRAHSLEKAVTQAGGAVLAELRYYPYKYVAARRKI